ncbi:amino acid adenylation domain-containing protein [Bradyrhizobium sp. DASA03120]|uniref:amino acid adenylation domain-containing protein n=1 Tax=Bradyrhizobium sp. SMVTL-02 TaxID=3395917 RepID=UPI003F726558
MLLKDSQRHSFPLRDQGISEAMIARHAHRIEGRAYGVIDLFVNGGASRTVRALLLVGLHAALRAYGDGTVTAVACAEATPGGLWHGFRVLPSMLDHDEQGRLSCLDAIEEIEGDLAREGCADHAGLLGRGLFDTILIVAETASELPDLQQFPLSVVARDCPSEGWLELVVNYAPQAIERRAVEGFADVLQSFVRQSVLDPTRCLADVELLSDAQRQQLAQWNNTDGDFPEGKRLEELFEEAVRRSPAKEALIYGDKRFSYSELNERCDHFAGWLLSRLDNRSNALIALFLDKSELTVISELGIWKAGAGFVPMDPQYPADRIGFTLRDTKAVRVLTNRHHVGKLRSLLQGQALHLPIDAIEDVLDDAAATERPLRTVPADAAGDIAYVAYTSGTTGVPKGVAKRHRSVVNSITDLSTRYGIEHSAEERIALFAAYVFEPFVRQMLIALINSHTLVVVPDEVRLDPICLPRFLQQNRITYLNGTGSVLQHYDLSCCSTLRKILLVGEELTASGLRALRRGFAGHVINEYSFTETAFVTAIKEFPGEVAERRDRSIGRPLRNVKCYILTSERKQVPPGAVGELFVGGEGIARGYLNRDDLTAQSFFENPYRTDAERQRGVNDLIYRTGDLARYLPGGEIEFLGRRDFQLKLNGVRIEPGEIEARVLEYSGIRQCVVVPRESGDERYLVAYFVAEPDREVSEAALRAHLTARLIKAMVPRRMIRLRSFPTNINGKIDRRALPPVDDDRKDRAEELAEPIDKTAQVLRTIWSVLLGVPQAQLTDDDDFFLLGGQSIACIRLIAKIWQQLRVQINVQQVFRHSQLGTMAAYLRQAGREAPRPNLLPSDPVATEPMTLRANGLQQGLMYHALKSGGLDDAYVVQSVYRYQSALKPDLLKQAWLHAQSKYPGLRSRFEWRDEPLQIIDPSQPLNWRFLDLSGLADSASQDARIRQLQQTDRSEPYLLTKGSLFRVYLVRQRADLFALLFSCHHIIIDGWSLQILHDEVHRIYLQLVKGEQLALSVDTAYVSAQRHWGAHRKDQLEYWNRQFERVVDRGDLGGLLSSASRYKVNLVDYDRVLQHRCRKLKLDGRRTLALKRQCVAHQVTLHSVLQFVWHRTLHAFGAAQTTVVGTIVSGRGLPIDEIEASVGLYINTLPLIVDHQALATTSVAAAVSEIQQLVNEMNSRTTVELGELQDSRLKHGMFDTLLVLESYPRLLTEAEAKQHDDVLRFQHEYDSDKVDYPMAVVAREEAGELTISLWFAGELFEDDAIDRLLGTAEVLFDQIGRGFATAVSDLEYLSAAEQASLDAWNHTEGAFPRHLTLHGVFEEVAARWAGEPAVACGDVAWTYRELNETANRIAHTLFATVPLRPDDLVALVMDKSERMVATILAVWKAGAAYVPIDPGSPDARISFMLEDTDARLVLVDSQYGDRLRALEGAAGRIVLEVDRLALDVASALNPETLASPTNLAYAIYTSGTTGQPKAVLVEHRGVVNLHSSLERIFDLARHKGRESILSFSNYVFDHFVEQMTDALLSGQKLVVLDDTMRTDPARLYRFMNDQQVTYLSGTPSVLSLYQYSTIPSLRRIDAIGEDFTIPKFNKIRSTFEGLIINGYGPTEISITSHKRLYANDEPRRDKSIGYPVANATCYVVSRDGKRLPIGGIGELQIGGEGVARGYLNRESLTRDRFIPNPFQTDEQRSTGANARLYRTGDLARWLPNGELEFLGRNDTQVKISGHRVELGEIEAVLSHFPGVTRAAVAARDDAGSGEKHLVAYYVSDVPIERGAIETWMRSKLPRAIVPTWIQRVDEMPLTINGKLDLRRLPVVEPAAKGREHYEPPSDDLEAQLCLIWSRVLAVPSERIGKHDDFFGLGGDSLRAIMLAQSISTDFSRKIDIASVFENSSIHAQAEYLRQHATVPWRAGESIDNVDATEGGDPLVSFAQERLLFIDEFEGGMPAYNIAMALEVALTGTTSPQSIVVALKALLQRHSALRTLLRGERNGVRLQHVLSASEAIERFSLTSTVARSPGELDALMAGEAAHVFRLETELPIRAGLFKLAGRDASIYVSIVAHHTCFDGRSWQIFRREFSVLCAQGDAAEIGQPARSYVDFALWQRQRLVGQRLVELRQFWLATLADHEPLNLPMDRPRPGKLDYAGGQHTFDIDPEVTQRLRALARATRVSFYSLLLGAFVLVLRVFSGQNDIVVGTPSANRIDPAFDKVIGFFANLLVLRIQVEGESSLATYLRKVADVVVRAMAHQELPFELLVQALNTEKDPSRHPVVQAVFGLVTDDPEPPTRSDQASLQAYMPRSERKTWAKFDVSATVTEYAGGMTVDLEYASSLFEVETIVSVAASFNRILVQLAGYSDAKAQLAISDLCSGERRPVSSSSQIQFGSPRTLHGVFEEVAARWAGEPAVACGDVAWTYRELNETANRIAHTLFATVPLRPDDLVALVMDKSERMVATILAVWKAGAAYVPIDPGSPDARISFMLEDTDARLVLVDSQYGDRLRALEGAAGRIVLEVDRLALDVASALNPETLASPTNLAYAIYTSGTTGQPKAVLVEHRGVAIFGDQIASMYQARNPSAQEAVLLTSNYAFDFSIEQLALSILSGNRLIIVAASVFSDTFYDEVNRHRISFLSGTPTQVEQMDLSRFRYLRHVLVAGEAFHPQHFDKIRREYSGVLFNAYGTTETTVYNLVRVFPPGEPYRNDLGQPLANARVCILNRDLRPVPLSALGELCIAGPCVARGYHNRPELSRERFLANILPTEDDQNARAYEVLYRTGDLVRWHPNGALEYLGRNDSQVKIRGVRIELSEVAAVLASFPGIRQSAVIARDGRLIGYYVSENDDPLDENEIVGFLQSRLLRGMVPGALVRLDGALPLTINGKLDSRGLPDPEPVNAKALRARPRNGTEARLLRLWTALLPHSEIGIDDDFFRCGGDSIAALQLTARMQRMLGLKLSVKSLFDYPTIRAYAQNALGDAATATPNATTSAPSTGSCPLLPIQQWFFAKPLASHRHWNQHFAIKTPALHIERLQTAVGKLVGYHDAFRLRFRRGDEGAIEQFYTELVAVAPIKEMDVRGMCREQIDSCLADSDGGFDLEHGPLYRTVYLHGFEDGSARIWLSVHHLIVDVVSWHVLTQDLEILYNGGYLGPSRTSYRQWAESVRDYVGSAEERIYWAEIAARIEAARATELGSSARPSAANHGRFRLSESQTHELLVVCPAAFEVSIIDLLTTVLGLALRAVTGRAINQMTVEGHGREAFDGAPDVSDSVGWFTTMYPIEIESHNDIERSIAAAKASRARAPYNGIGYGALRGRYGSAVAPLPPVSLNYLGIVADCRYPKEGWLLDPAMCGTSRSTDATDSLLDVTIQCVDGSLIVDIDSRSPLAVTRRLAAEFERQLKLVVSRQRPGPTLFSQVARMPASPIDGYEPYVLANEMKLGPRLFVLPPGEGGAESYLGNLGKHLASTSMVLFNNVHRARPMSSFEALARYYIDQIRSIQRAGPYHLCGWSFGGVLAVEMAVQLTRAGESISSLILIDPFFDVSKALADLDLQGEALGLDPIYQRYRPASEDLQRLCRRTQEILLFKATHPDSHRDDSPWSALFDYYARSDANNLDVLVGSAAFSTVKLPGQTHFSWVNDRHTVSAMADRIEAVLRRPAHRPEHGYVVPSL